MKTIFVYGTLMAGFHNHNYYLGDVVEAGEARLVGKAILGDHQMLHLGGFPGIIPREYSSVLGEVYEVSDAVVPMLDRLEGHPTFYRRTPAQVLLVHNGAPVEVEVYVLASPEHYEGRNPVVASGDWHRRAERPVEQEGA